VNNYSGRFLILYARSEKIDVVEYTMPNWGHGCSAAYRSQGTMNNFSPEDYEAIECLKQKGTPFSLVDLSDCPFTTRLSAMMKGINKTPTLILNNGSKLKGIDEIKENMGIV
jgi:hypothetical protein